MTTPEKVGISSYQAELDSPAFGGFAISPSDSTVFRATRCIYVGTTGDLSLTMFDGTTITIKNAAVGYHPLRATQVKAASTASDLVGLY